MADESHANLKDPIGRAAESRKPAIVVGIFVKCQSITAGAPGWREIIVSGVDLGKLERTADEGIVNLDPEPPLAFGLFRISQISGCRHRTPGRTELIIGADDQRLKLQTMYFFIGVLKSAIQTTVDINIGVAIKGSRKCETFAVRRPIGRAPNLKSLTGRIAFVSEQAITPIR